MARLLAAALLLFAAACGRRIEEISRPNLSALIGASEATVVQRMGPPARSFDTANLRYLVYDRVDIERAPGARPAEFPCRITFILEAGRVRSFDQQGGGCD